MRAFIAMLMLMLGIVAYSVETRADQPNGLESLAEPIRQLLAKADVVFVGEYHSMKNHKDVFLSIMSPLIEAGAIDVVALEFIQYVDNDLLREYLRDPRATPGTQDESQYFLKFSNCNRRCGEYGSSGGWPIADAYQNVLREMRRLVRAYPGKIKFCGINSDQFYQQQFYELNSDVAGLKALTQPARAIAMRIFGIDSLLPADGANYGWGSGALREARFAEGLVACIANSKIALALTGAFHAMKLSKLGVKTSGVNWSTAADLVSELSGKSTASGIIVTSSERQMADSIEGPFSAAFQNKYKTDLFSFRKTSALADSIVRDSVERGLPTFSLYDFAIFGPTSGEAGNAYSLPDKPSADLPAAGELANISFKVQNVELRPRLGEWRVAGSTKIDFQVGRTGRFMFQFWGRVASVRIDGAPANVRLIPSASPLMSPVYVVDSPLRAGVVHRAEVAFDAPSGSYAIFEGERGKLLTLETRFDNRYGIAATSLFPSINLPTVKPRLTVTTFDSHDFNSGDENAFCRCAIDHRAGSISFAFGSTPSQQIYFQLRPKVLGDMDFSFDARPGLRVSAKLSHFFFGAEYLRKNRKFAEARASLASELVEPLRNAARETIAKMESLVGPYPHGSALLIDVHPQYHGDSMEYAGAVHTGLGLLTHEIIHQWFATSVKPRTNADAWLMESITTWIERRKFADVRRAFEPFMKSRDSAFQPSADSLNESWDAVAARKRLFDPKFCPSPARTEFCEGFSFDWYAAGPALFDQIDSRLKQASAGKVDLSTALKAFFEKYRDRYVTAAEFVETLRQLAPSEDWNAMFAFTR